MVCESQSIESYYEAYRPSPVMRVSHNLLQLTDSDVGYLNQIPYYHNVTYMLTLEGQIHPPHGHLIMFEYYSFF